MFQNRKSYTYDEVYNSTLNYFHGDTLAANVWITKYCLKTLSDDGVVLYYEKTPKDMFKRLASEFYRVGMHYKNPLSYDEIYSLIDDFKYIVPQGRPMAGIGNNDEAYVSISNCFVIGHPEEDSYGSICRTDQEMIQLFKRGGGVGTDISHFRANGSKVRNAAISSTGPVDICANRFSMSAREVGQDGRRAAEMISMDITHPDVEKFIDAKMNETKVNGANISVKMYDEWLESALGINCDIDSEKERLWKKIIHNNTVKAEPGILFWSTIIKESVPDCYSDLGFKTLSTNPCGEIPLCDADSCRLMLLNLYSYVINPFTKDARFDFDLLADHSRKITKLMDNMIDLEMEKVDSIIRKINSDPESEITKNIELTLWKRIREKLIKGRRAGIGTTAVADMLAALGLTYGTKDASNFAQEVQKTIALNVYIESCDLVQRDGREPFEIFDWNREKSNPFLLRLVSGNDKYSKEFNAKWKGGRRNIALLTNAPAGSVSIETQTTSGIDPLFLIAYKRYRKLEKNGDVKPDFVDKIGDWYQEYLVIHPKFITWYSISNNISFDEASKILSSMKQSEFNLLLEKSPYYKATTADTDWVEKVRMQGMLQQYVDHSISTTVNLPKGTSEDVVKQVYETAWRSGCKGCTIYVDGSRDGILNTVSNTPKEQTKLENNAPKRPKSLSAKIVRFNNNYEKWVAVVGFYNNEPYEIFTGLLDKLNIPNYVESGYIIKAKETVSRINSDTGELENVVISRYDLSYKDNNGEDVIVEGLSRTFRPEYWNYAKLISGLMRHGMPLPYIIKSISSLNLDDEHLNTWKNGIIRCLRKLIKDTEETGEVCPNCKGKIVREGGCFICKNCGYSKCG